MYLNINKMISIQVQYECGNYLGASEYLYFHRILVQSTDVNYLNGMWGKLASEILMQSWDTALEDFTRLLSYFIERKMQEHFGDGGKFQ